jgi:hypothetical protein
MELAGLEPATCLETLPYANLDWTAGDPVRSAALAPGPALEAQGHSRTLAQASQRAHLFVGCVA